MAAKSSSIDSGPVTKRTVRGKRTVVPHTPPSPGRRRSGRSVPSTLNGAHRQGFERPAAALSRSISAAWTTRRRPRRPTTSRSIRSTGSSSAAAGSRRGAGSTSRPSARRPSKSSPRSPRRTRRTSTTPCKAAREAYEKYWSKMRGADRAKYIFRIARAIQEKARELAIVESMDGGKPIKESRDVDVPLAAAHFFYHAGWADKLDYAFQGRKPRPLGVAGQIIPWNFPLLMAAWKIAPALACGNTVRPEARRDDAAHRAPPREDHRRGGAAARASSTSSPARARPARRSSNHPDVDKVAFTGSTDVGKRIQRALAGTDEAPHPRARRQGGEHRLRRRADRSGGRRHRQRHLLQPGPRVLRGLAPPRRGERARHRRAQAPATAWRRCASAIRSTRTPTSARSTRRCSSSGSASSSTSGEKEGAERFSAPCALPEKGFWFAPTFFTGASQSRRIAREEIFGPVLTIMTFRTPDEAVEKANNTMYGLSAGVWTDKGAKIFYIAHASCKAGVIWGNTFNKFDPELAVRWLQGERLRSRRRAPGPARVPRGGVMMARDQGREDGRRPHSLETGDAPLVKRWHAKARVGVREGLQDVRRRRVRALRVGPLLPGAGDAEAAARTAPTRERSRAARARTSATRCSPRRTRSHGWEKRTAFNRGQILYRLAEVMERAPRGAPALARARRADADAARARSRSTHRSIAPSSTPASPTSSRPLRVAQPGRRPALQLQRPRADGRHRRRRPDGARRCSASSRAPAGHHRRQHLRRARERGRSAHGDRLERGARDERPARRRRQHPHRPRDRSCRTSPSTWRWRRSTCTASTPSSRASSRRPRSIGQARPDARPRRGRVVRRRGLHLAAGSSASSR